MTNFARLRGEVHAVSTLSSTYFKLYWYLSIQGRSL